VTDLAILCDHPHRVALFSKAPNRCSIPMTAIAPDQMQPLHRSSGRDTPLARYSNFHQWLSDTQLRRDRQPREYAMSSLGPRAHLDGTHEQIKERVAVQVMGMA
jgi:hypothetical protein